MIARLACIAAIVLCASHAEAHRLDEYLQQTLIDLGPARIALEIDLTPGVAVASQVIPAVDRDGDGVVSAREQAAYAEAVRRNLSLRFDDTGLPLRVVTMQYPTIPAMAAGTGTIALRLEATLPSGLGTGTLHLTNHHVTADSAYLVNCLLPRRPIRVLAQSRSHDQSEYSARVDFGTPAHTPMHWFPWAVGVAIVAGAVLVWMVRTHRSRRSWTSRGSWTRPAASRRPTRAARKLPRPRSLPTRETR